MRAEPQRSSVTTDGINNHIQLVDKPIRKEGGGCGTISHPAHQSGLADDGVEQSTHGELYCGG